MMPRPRKPRQVEFLPQVTYFKPAGVPLSELAEVRLGVDELEALRLKELENLDQNECAERMNLAQSTLQRVLAEARKKIVQALVEGRAIRIEGGSYEHVVRQYFCGECGARWQVKRAGDGEQCPDCGRSGAPRWQRGRGRKRGS